MITGRSARLLLSVLATLAASVAIASPASAAPAGLAVWHDSSATELGALPARPLSVTLDVDPAARAALRAFVAAPHAALTPAQFNAQYAPGAATVTAIRPGPGPRSSTSPRCRPTACSSSDRFLAGLRDRAAHQLRALRLHA